MITIPELRKAELDVKDNKMLDKLDHEGILHKPLLYKLWRVQDIDYPINLLASFYLVNKKTLKKK